MIYFRKKKQRNKVHDSDMGTPKYRKQIMSLHLSRKMYSALRRDTHTPKNSPHPFSYYYCPCVNTLSLTNG